MQRRVFLKSAALAVAGTFAARAQTPRGGVCLHAFSKPFQWLDYDRLAETLAQAGYGGIDLTVRPGGHVEPENVARDLPRAVEAARRQGLRLDMIVTAILAADEPHAERVLKTAAQCGVRLYRMGYLRYDAALSVEEAVEKNHRQLAALAELNRACGIAGCYQNHYAWSEGLFGGPVWDLCEALKGLDPRWIGSQYDVRHAVAESAGSWAVGMRRIAPYIRSVCLKDFAWAKKKDKWIPETVFAGEGAVPWARFFGLLKALKDPVPASVHCEWELFTKEEQALPENERRAVALRKMKRDADFFAAAYAKYGAVTG